MSSDPAQVYRLEPKINLTTTMPHLVQSVGVEMGRGGMLAKVGQKAIQLSNSAQTIRGCFTRTLFEVHLSLPSKKFMLQLLIPCMQQFFSDTC